MLPHGRERPVGRSAWGWVDDFPADVPARPAAETEVAEAVLAFSELWLAAPGTHRVVRADQLVAELCRLAATVPFAHVVRQLRESMWVSGAECLLSAAARVAGDDETLLGRVHQTARALARTRAAGGIQRAGRRAGPVRSERGEARPVRPRRPRDPRPRRRAGVGTDVAL